jgi:trigger factor
MKFDIENLEGHKKKISVEVPPEIVTGAFNRVLRSMQNEVEIKGFRKGKVPMDLLKTQFQADTSKHVIRELIEESLPVALKNNSLKPAENPKIEPGPLLDGFPFKYTAIMECIPPIELKNYLSFKTKWENVSANDEEVDKSVERLHNSLAHYHDSDVEELNGNYAGDLEVWAAESSEKLAEAKSSRFVHDLGAGPLVENMESKIKGMKKGETREFTADVPAGEDSDETKPFYYKVYLHGIKEKHIPPLDDEAAKRFGNFTSVKELRQKIAEEIAAQKQNSQREAIRQQIVEHLLKEHEVSVPESMKARWMQTLVFNYASELGRIGLSQDQIEEKLKEQSGTFLTAAESQAKASLLLDAIGDKEKIQATEEDFRKEIVRMAMEQGRNPKDVYQEVENKGLLGAVLERIEEVKTLDWLLGKAIEA